LLLGGVAAVIVVLVLILLTGGFLIYCVLAIAGFALVASLHYLLWGKALEESVAGQREEERLRRRAEQNDGDWDVPHARPDPRGIRRP
jgi:hypothetical protein